MSDITPLPPVPAAAPIGFAAMAAMILFNLPELLLINLELWATIVAAIWAIGGLLGKTFLAYLVPAVILVVPGLAVTAWTLMRAVANEAQTTDTI